MAETAEDREWKASMDASTLVEADQIRADKKRLAAAKKTAKQKANEFAKAAGGTTGKVVGDGMVQLDG